jgi:hypothetical protein
MLELQADIRTINLATVCRRLYGEELTEDPAFDPDLVWVTDENRGKTCLSSQPKVIVIDGVMWRGYDPYQVYGPATWEIGGIKLTLAIEGEKRSERFNRKLSIAVDANTDDEHTMRMFDGLGYLLEDGSMVLTGGHPMECGIVVGLMRSNPPHFTVHLPDLELKTA